MRHLVNVLSLVAALLLGITSSSTSEANLSDGGLPCPNASTSPSYPEVMFAHQLQAIDPQCCVDLAKVAVRPEELPSGWEYKVTEYPERDGHYMRLFSLVENDASSFSPMTGGAVQIQVLSTREAATQTYNQFRDVEMKSRVPVSGLPTIGDESIVLDGGVGHMVLIRRGTYYLFYNENKSVNERYRESAAVTLSRAKVMVDRIDIEIAKLSPPVQSPTPSAPVAACSFTLGFKALHDQLPDTVGTCLENEHFNPANGNAEQRTSGGLLVWRKADNWTAFTNGSTSWINGPQGLANRPNSGPLFAWEAGGSVVAPPAPSSTPSVNISTALLPAWNMILGLPKLGTYVKGAVPPTGVKVEVQALPAGMNGVFSPASNTIGISQAIMGESPRAVAGVLAHELRHSIQHAADPQGIRDCIPQEVEAFMFQAGVWYEANNGYGPSRTSLERHNSTIARIAFTDGEPGMYTAVVNEPGYQEECKLFVPR